MQSTKLFVFILVMPALLFEAPLRARTGLNLDAPLQTIITREQRFALSRDLATRCPHRGLTLSSPIREFITKTFYRECIDPEEPARGFDYPAPGKFEMTLRQILAPHWLALQMSDEEIALYEQDPLNALFKPLDTIDFQKYGHDLARRYWILKHDVGILVIRDFLRAWEEEEQSIPAHKRFKKISNFGFSSFEKMRRAIEQELNKSKPTIPDPTPEITAWLKLARSSENAELRNACEIILTHYGARFD